MLLEDTIMVYYVFNNGKPLGLKPITCGIIKPRTLCIVHYCQHCNTELVGEWELFIKGEWGDPRLKDDKELKKVLDFAQLEECPICGEKFEQKKEHHFINVAMLKRESRKPYFAYTNPSMEIVGVNYFPLCDYCEQNIESILRFLREFRSKSLNTVVENKMTAFIDKCIIESVSTNSIKLKEKLNIKGYLEQLLIIEKNIFSISKRLRELYFLSYEAERDAIASEKIPLLNDKKNIEKAFDAYQSLQAKNVEEEINKADFRSAYPKEPKMPRKPKAPILAKPGFFNKKRVLAENALLTEKYEKELEIYNASVEKFESDMKQRKEIIALLKKDCEDKYNSAIKKAKESLDTEIIKSKAKYEDLLKEYEEKLSAKDIPTPEKAKHILLREEIKTAEELLKNFYNAQHEMYSCGIIFEKYRNFVSVSSFYEYISSGRCETLEGANGAYNLYENELRMNMVIGQLNQVIESLEEIKQNQYMIYSAINETNKQLSKLNSSMSSVISTLSSIKADTSDMKSYMSKIADNTEVIAYNTEKTAFYAKKNAELTNALGYMVAFK